MRWTWIDRFTAFTPGRAAVAVKCLSHAEDHFADHYPGFPVMPAALILEGLAQTGGILVGHANEFRLNVVLAKIPHATFHREAGPGETLTYRADLTVLRDEGAIVAGRVTCGEHFIAEADIFFAHVDAAKAAAVTGGRNFVFDGLLKGLLNVAALPPAD